MRPTSDPPRRDPAGRRGPLLPPVLRRSAALAAVVAAAGTAVLGWKFAGDGSAGRVDRTLSGLVSARTGAGEVAEHVLSTIGGPFPTAVALCALAVVGHRLRGPRGLALVLVGPPLAMVTTSLVLKPLIDRTHDGGLAFPSGHTTAVGSLCVTTAVLVAGLATLPVVVRVLATVPLMALVVAVGVSMAGQHIHYPTDTIGGAGVAVAAVLAVALAVDPVADAVEGPPPPADEPTVRFARVPY